MSIKISELPTGDALDGTELVPVVQAETIQTTIDDVKSYVSALPVNTIDNTIFPVTLSTYGLWDAVNGASSLNDITLPDPANHTGKFLILRNTNGAGLPLAGGTLVAADGSIASELPQERAYTCISNGTDWFIVGEHAV